MDKVKRKEITNVMSPIELKRFIEDTGDTVKSFAEKLRIDRTQLSHYIHNRPRLVRKGTINYEITRALVKAGLPASKLVEDISEVPYGRAS